MEQNQFPADILNDSSGGQESRPSAAVQLGAVLSRVNRGGERKGGGKEGRKEGEVLTWNIDTRESSNESTISRLSDRLTNKSSGEGMMTSVMSDTTSIWGAFRLDFKL